jgi:tetratricopeptide (TPR) repeat protein
MFRMTWTLVIEERYAEAVAAFTEELRARHSASALNNRGMAYLHLNEFDAALADFDAAAEHRRLEASRYEMPAADRTMSGVALWLANRFQEALETWAADVEARLAGEARYGDAAGGVTPGNLLLFAAVRLENGDAQALAIRHLKKRLRTKQSGAWPGAVSRYLLGKLPEAEMLLAVSPTPILHERQLCQALFYTGVKSLMEGDHLAFRQKMQDAYQYGRVARLECEYYLATSESRR